MLKSVSSISKPTVVLPLILGKLNVVLPSPEPYLVPITANNSAYSVLLIACPLHSSQFVGIVVLNHSTTEPIGKVSDTVPPLPPIAFKVPSSPIVKLAPTFITPKSVVVAIGNWLAEILVSLPKVATPPATPFSELGIKSNEGKLFKSE